MDAQRGCFYVELEDAAGAAGCLNQANPEEADLIITRMVLRVPAQSAGGARTLNIGTGVAGADNNNVFVAAAAATGATLDNMFAAGAGTGVAVRWGAAQFLTVTANADPADQVAALYIEYIRE
jgi:hypothetical protein